MRNMLMNFMAEGEQDQGPKLDDQGSSAIMHAYKSLAMGSEDLHDIATTPTNDQPITPHDQGEPMTREKGKRYRTR